MTDLTRLQGLIEAAYERRAELTPQTVSAELAAAIEECIGLLDSGTARVAEPAGSGWSVNEWLKKAVLLSFRMRENQVVDAEIGRASCRERVCT